MKKDKDALSKNIIATLVFYDLLGWPLSSFEVYQYLVEFEELQETLTYLDIKTTLRALKKQGKVAEKRGFFCLDESEGLIKTRIEKNKKALQKWKLAQKRLSLLTKVPFVEAAFVSGSLGVGNTDTQSDIDLLVIASKNHVWTVRFLLHFVFASLGWRRQGDDTKNKVCLYHFLETEDLELSSKSIYDAQIYAHFLPFFDRDQYTKKFCRQNNWVEAYLHKSFAQNKVPLKKSGSHLQAFLERILSNFLGAGLERLFRGLQKFKIKKTPTKGNENAYIEGGKLAFHPRVREKNLREKYEKRIERLGF